MKKILIILFLFSCNQISFAQSGWSTGSYYNERGSADVTCSDCYSSFQGYDRYGYPIYYYYQDCRKRNWYSWTGGRWGYVWIWNGYKWTWDYRYEERTWWYYEWYDYTKGC